MGTLLDEVEDLLAELGACQRERLRIYGGHVCGDGDGPGGQRVHCR